jgi:hypothetical protein
MHVDNLYGKTCTGMVPYGTYLIATARSRFSIVALNRVLVSIDNEKVYYCTVYIPVPHNELSFSRAPEYPNIGLHLVQYNLPDP